MTSRRNKQGCFFSTSQERSFVTEFQKSPYPGLLGISGHQWTGSVSWAPPQHSWGSQFIIPVLSSSLQGTARVQRVPCALLLLFCFKVFPAVNCANVYHLVPAVIASCVPLYWRLSKGQGHPLRVPWGTMPAVFLSWDRMGLLCIITRIRFTIPTDWLLYSELRITSTHLVWLRQSSNFQFLLGEYLQFLAFICYKQYFAKIILCIDLCKSLFHLPLAISFHQLCFEIKWWVHLMNAVTPSLTWVTWLCRTMELNHWSHWMILKEYTHLLHLGLPKHLHGLCFPCQPGFHHLSSSTSSPGVSGHGEADHFQGMGLWLLNQHNPTKEQMLLLQRIFFKLNIGVFIAGYLFGHLVIFKS